MSRYDLLVYLHIVAAIIWLGAGATLAVMAYRAERANDAEGLRRFVTDSAGLANVIFIPASLAVLVFGGLLVADGPWTMSTLWVALGLAGYLASFLTGILVLKPVAERVAGLIERDGGMSADATQQLRRLLVIDRVETLILFLVAAVMVFKPTGDDAALLGVLAGLTVACLLHGAVRLRALAAAPA